MELENTQNNTTLVAIYTIIFELISMLYYGKYSKIEIILWISLLLCKWVR